MHFNLHSWTVNKHPATVRKVAYAHVTIRGYHTGILRKNWKSEAYNIPLVADPLKNTNKELVKRAMELSAGRWSIPWGMNFN